MLRTKGKTATTKKKPDLTYKGVKYKSPLEVFTAKQLELAGLPNYYEGWKVPLVEKFTSICPSWEVMEKKDGKVWGEVSRNIRTITYSPDFPSAPSLEEIDGGWVLEVKGQRMETFNQKWKLFHNYLTEKGVKVTLYMPKSQAQVLWCIQHIKDNLL